MILTTGPNIDGRQVIQYCGIVHGEAILGANIFKDFFAGIRDVVGASRGLRAVAATGAQHRDQRDDPGS